MLIIIEEILENGQIILKEKLVINQKVKVLISFAEEIVQSGPASIASPSALLRGAWKDISKEDREEIDSYFQNLRSD
ncbi:hypothetical protein [Dyadobacter chenhuakuii]|uniref:Uncharacterized protein n=1 Tax=Dyadobacter chenhuakuii TaxID=2909339 RepID=A0A9X1TVS6_9BACT|nr:hypothetical protein [Dyadobacter chenhuakuii]MCF2500377.1 hypothetical protein [Dyadobacter chenhuakuii]